jgi:hexosaminidase
MGRNLDRFFKAKRPAVSVRGVHLDLKGLPPTPKRMLELLELIAAARYNAVLAEWEDMFPWTFDKNFRSPYCYTAKDIRSFHQAATKLGIEFIPLVQCMGHMETPLNVAKYKRLRELPFDCFGLNPLAKGAKELVQGMVDDVIALMPGLKHFHLGGDEAWTMGRHPDTKAFIEKHGKAKLYLQHVEPILENLNARGIRPILWHDMMSEWDAEALKALAPKADLLTWGYGGHPDNCQYHCNTRYLKKFHENGITLWGGTAYKGADGHNVDLPVIRNREENALAWMDIASRFSYKGVITTAWSRYSTHRVQCEPIDACLDSLVEQGIILHDGKAPEGGIETCVKFLEAVGEKARFEACKKSMEKLSSLRQRAWRNIQNLHEQLALSEKNPIRRGSFAECGELRNLRNTVKEADAIAAEAKKIFAGLAPKLSMQEYLDSRIDPLKLELKGLDARTRKVDPNAWKTL